MLVAIANDRGKYLDSNHLLIGYKANAKKAPHTKGTNIKAPIFINHNNNEMETRE